MNSSPYTLASNPANSFHSINYNRLISTLLDLHALHLSLIGLLILITAKIFQDLESTSSVAMKAGM